MIGKSCVDVIESLFQILSASLICQHIILFVTSSIGFCMAIARYIMNSVVVFYSVIWEKAGKTNKVVTSLLQLTELVIALQAICSENSGYIPGILVIIIVWTWCKGPQ